MLTIHATAYRYGFRYDAITACHWVCCVPGYPSLIVFSGWTALAEFGAN